MSDVLERFFARLDPILERFDRLLAAFAGRTPGPEELAAHHAFRWRSLRGLGRLEAVEAVSRFDLEDLIGVAPAIESLDRNTRQLIAGLPFNDVLLFGARGTGKSSAVRGLLARHAAQGLRLVEVDRSDLAELPELLAVLHRVTKAAPERYSFVVFCDDLSFGTSEVGFRELKAALEGGIEALPRAFVRNIAPERLITGKRVIAIDCVRREVVVANGKRVRFERIISTLPLPVTVRLMGTEAPEDIVRRAGDHPPIAIPLENKWRRA